ncbi:MAG TPA: enoyl-CoA hydratase/isomerase family protein [Candidatus Dormibacteraeota bacterium]
MSYRTILYEVDDRVATVTLNRPDKMNAMSQELIGELEDAIRAADEDPDVRVVVLTGAGGKAFSAGYDISGVDGSMSTVEEWSQRMHRDYTFSTAVWKCSKPVIAMIDGYCLAGGLELAQMCDIRYCSSDSTFGVVETRFSTGIVSLAMPWIVGARCRELIYTGDLFAAAEALRIGLVNRVFPASDLRQETLKIAKRMSRVALAALQWNKRAINNTYAAMGFHTAMQYGVVAASILDATQTPEYQAWEEIRRSQGLAEANRWRRDLFAPYE